MSAALVLTGAPGTGKTSVLDALGTLLEVEGIAYGALESEQLSRGSPLLSADQWLPQLDAVITLQRQAGRELFLVAATTESATELRGVVEAVGADTVIVVCLSASPDLAGARIAEREPDAWPGKQALIAHARNLATTIPSFDGIDLVISTAGRDSRIVATRVRDELYRRGVVEHAG